jgi:hypothetical protein
MSPFRPFVLAALLLAAGCESQPSRPALNERKAPPPVARPEPTPSASSARAVAPPPPDIRDLEQRPGHTFTEAELGRFIAALHVTEPDPAARVVRLARQNLGQPYDIYLLGEYPFELHDPDPIYCLARSDCLTFCEHVYAAALSCDWWSYLAALQRLRYRDGVIGMLTRNHYTEADWNPANAFVFDDLTATLAAGRAHVPLRATIRRARFFAQFGIGQDIPDETLEEAYIPTERIPEILEELSPGDMVNIVRGDAQSQWVGHTGLITHGAAGAVNFLHSARPAVREERLLDYVMGDTRCVGIRILRLRPDAQACMERALADPARATPVDEAALAAALGRSPLETAPAARGAPATAARESSPLAARAWDSVLRLQGFRLGYETPTDPALQPALERLDREIGGRLGIADADRAFGVLDLSLLRFAAVRPDDEFYGASVPKIVIVLAYFAKHPEAADQLDSQTAHELGMVLKRSDNELAAKYSQLVGLPFIQDLLTSERYAFYDAEQGGGLWCGKHYNIDEPCTVDPVKGHAHAATVRQCLRYYLLLEQGKLVSPGASARIKQLFASPQLEFHDNRFVRALSGRPVTILRKSGEWEDWQLDTARVQHGERAYVIAGMAHHARGAEYLTEMAAAVDSLLCGTPEAREGGAGRSTH